MDAPQRGGEHEYVLVVLTNQAPVRPRAGNQYVARRLSALTRALIASRTR